MLNINGSLWVSGNVQSELCSGRTEGRENNSGQPDCHILILTGRWYCEGGGRAAGMGVGRGCWEVRVLERGLWGSINSSQTDPTWKSLGFYMKSKCKLIPSIPHLSVSETTALLGSVGRQSSCPALDLLALWVGQSGDGLLHHPELAVLSVTRHPGISEQL